MLKTLNVLFVAATTLLACALFFSMGAHAQDIGIAEALPSPRHVQGAFDQILDRGILGALVIIEAVVIALLVRATQVAQKEVLSWAIASTKAQQATEQALVKATEQLARNEAVIAQVLSRQQH
jgi:hypothetical protein